MARTHDFSQLDDAALLVNVKRLAGGSNEITAQLLAHPGEVEARGVYRELACSSLYTYCVYELRMSEDEAQRRCRAARATRQFPRLLDMLADASIHLTGILLLAPHLTQENHVEVLLRARFRTKREIEKLVAELAPRPDTRASVEPLALAARAPGGHAAMVTSLCGYVRELVAGDARHQAPMGPIARGVLSADGMAGEGMAGEALAGSACEHEPTPVEPARRNELGRAHSPAPMRYKVQFTADQAYVDLLEEARDLLQHEIPDRDLVRVQRRAMQALVEQLRRRKYAAVARPRTRSSEAEPQSVVSSKVAASGAASPPAPAPARQVVASAEGPAESPPAPSLRAPPIVPSLQAPSASRHLAAAVKRAVWQRDQGRCAYVDSRGERCRERAGIEFHHQRAYARGGGATVDNIALRCRAHNGLAAEQDFGREYMDGKREGDCGPC